MWQDPEFFLALISTLPPIVNATISGIDEFLIQLREKMSPLLLHDFLRSMASSVDRKTLESIVKNSKGLAVDLFAVADEVLQETGEETLTGKEGK